MAFLSLAIKQHLHHQHSVMWPLQPKTYFSHPSFFIYFWNLTHKTEIGIAAKKVRETTNSNPLGLIKLPIICTFWLKSISTTTNTQYVASAAKKKKKKKKFTNKTKVFFFPNLTHKTKIGTASRWKRLVIANPVEPIRLSNVYGMCMRMLVGCSLLRSFLCFSTTHVNEPVFFSTPICGFGILGCTRIELSAIQQLVVIPSN